MTTLMGLVCRALGHRWPVLKPLGKPTVQMLDLGLGCPQFSIVSWTPDVLPLSTVRCLRCGKSIRYARMVSDGKDLSISIEWSTDKEFPCPRR